MSVIYAAVMGMFIVLAVVVGAIKCRTRNWLVAFMGFLAVYSGLILLDSFNVRISPTAYFVLLSFTFLPGPLILGYVSHISTREEVHLKDFTFCLLPIVIALFCSDLLGGFPLFSLVPREAYEIESYIMMFNLVSAMAGIHLLVYLARASYLILKMKRDWTAYQSRTLPESWYDMIKVLLVMVIANGTQVLSAFMHPTGQEISIGDLGFMILVVHFVYLSARVMFRSKQAEGQDDDVICEERVYLAPRPEPASDLLQDAQRIEKIIHDKSCFLDAELSLPSLAEIVGVSPHRLSEILNSGFQKSFYEYINDLRVAYAANLLISAPDKSVTEVFYTAGFSNKSTFYGYFKKTYLATPSSFRKQVSKSALNSVSENSVQQKLSPLNHQTPVEGVRPNDISNECESTAISYLNAPRTR